MPVTRWDNSQTPDVLKTITLTDDERRRYRRGSAIQRRLRHRFSEVIQGILEEGLSAEDDVWDEFAKRFGYEDLYAVYDANCALTISWTTGVLTLRGRADTAGPEGSTVARAE